MVEAGRATLEKVADVAWRKWLRVRGILEDVLVRNTGVCSKFGTGFWRTSNMISTCRNGKWWSEAAKRTTLEAKYSKLVI